VRLHHAPSRPDDFVGEASGQSANDANGVATACTLTISGVEGAGISLPVTAACSPSVAADGSISICLGNTVRRIAE
jgi:hypothetical protein